MNKKLIFISCLVVSFLLTNPAFCQENLQKTFNSLSGIWKSSDGGTYYIQTDGDDIYWVGESGDGGVAWTNLFVGKIDKNQIKGKWLDFPKGRNRLKGNLVLQIASDYKSLSYVEGTGGFGGRSWTKVNPQSPTNPQQSTVKVKEVEPKEVGEKYRGHSYKFIPVKESWNKAKVIAKEMGGYLVSITSDEENKFVVSLIQRASIECQDKNPEVWIGLNNDNEEKQWKWESGEKYEYNSWWEGEPNNWANSESSVVINKQSLISPESVGKWNDKSSDFKTYFVVERNIP